MLRRADRVFQVKVEERGPRNTASGKDIAIFPTAVFYVGYLPKKFHAAFQNLRIIILVLKVQRPKLKI